MAVLKSNPPEQGQIVSARSRNWMVTGVARSTLPPKLLRAGLEPLQHLLTFSSLDDGDSGRAVEAQILRKSGSLADCNVWIEARRLPNRLVAIIQPLKGVAIQ